MANGALSVGQLLFCILEGRVPRVEVALPLGDLFGELGISAGERGELELERFEAACRRCELLAQVTLAVRRYFELCLRLSAPDLASGALFPSFVLRVLGAGEHLARGRDRGFALRDPGFDLAGARRDRFDSSDRGCYTLGQSFDQRPCFSGLPGGPLVLPCDRSGAIGSVRVLARCL